MKNFRFETGWTETSNAPLVEERSLTGYLYMAEEYGHLTSSVMMAQVDERLKRRFSVSASMEEISKIAEMKAHSSQANFGPEQAALAQSQHFDQLEALWNKRSPPRRRRNNAVSIFNCISIQVTLIYVLHRINTKSSTNVHIL